MAALFFTIIPVAIALLIIIWRFMQTEEEKLGARYRKQALLRISTSDRQNNGETDTHSHQKYEKY